LIETTNLIPSRFTMLALCVLAVLMAPQPSGALDLKFSPDLKKAGWRLHTPRGHQPASFVVETDGSLSVSADGAVSFLYATVPDVTEPLRILSWQWLINKDFPGTDLSMPGADDRALAVHVYFSDENPSLMTKLGRGMASLFGAPVSGRALTYVWGGKRSVGTVIPNPFMDEGDGAIIIRRSGPPDVAGTWMNEEINVADDYQSAFGKEAPKITVVAVSADTDDTGAFSQARIRGLKLAAVSTSLR